MASETPREAPRSATLAPMRPWQVAQLTAIVALSASLNLVRLAENGYGSLYYAAAVKSMLHDAHNFFFVAFDPAGFVSVDKPPLGFWIQALFAKLLGFSGLSILLPQALMGVLTVFALFFVVRRACGVVPGLLSSFMMATTPIAVATSRSNHLDVALTLLLVLAAWAALVASEKGSLGWLVVSGAVVGLGFNVKMLEAYLVVPALGALYLAVAPIRLGRRAAHLGCAAAVMLALSVSWALAVDMTPAGERPYIDSTEDNSELGLAFGYNGINRLVYPGAQAPKRPSRAGDPAPGPPSTKEIGPRGPLRLVRQPLAAQVGWLLPWSVLGAMALLWRKKGETAWGGVRWAAILFGLWLLTIWAVLSSATFFHAYYLVTMAPPIAALSGAGFVVLASDFVELPATDGRAWGLPLGIALSALFEVHVLGAFPGWSRWMSPIVIATAILSMGALLLVRVLSMRGRPMPQRVARVAAGLGIASLLFPSVVWSMGSLTYVANSDSPSGGPTAESLSAAIRESRQPSHAGGPFQLTFPNPRLRDYLEAHQEGERFMVGSLFSNRASAALILASDRAVMSLGGFRGTTPILNVEQLVTRIRSREVRFFYLPLAIHRARNGESLTPLEGRNVALVRFIADACEEVPEGAWESGAPVRHVANVPVRDLLFDCANLKDSEPTAP